MSKQKRGAGEGECGAPCSKRDAVLSAAREIFLECGYAAASMDAVAAAANVSKATIYAHFENKRALFEAVLGHRCRATFGLFDVPDERLDGREALLNLGRVFLDLILSPEGVAIHRVVIGEAPRLPEVGETFYRVGPTNARALISRMLRDLTQRGLLAVAEDEVALATDLLCATLKGDLHMRALLGMPTEEDERERYVVGVVDMFMARYGVK